MIPDIILIGPIRSGKSTLGKLLAVELGVPQVSLDAHCWNYYREFGIDTALDAKGPDHMIASRFNVHAVERLLSEHRDCVFDLGAGHSVYRDADGLRRVQRAFAPYPNVFLLLPCADLDKSAAILRERNVHNDWLHTFQAQHGYDPNDHFLRHPSNFTLAKCIVYTEDKSPEQTTSEILNRATRQTFGT